MFEFERQRVPITRIRIHRVLGDPNANVALSFPPEGGGVRILHGRNGSGKTSILDLINRAFSDGPFDARHLWASGGEIEFALEDGRRLLLAAPADSSHREAELTVPGGPPVRETLAPRRKDGTTQLLATFRQDTRVVLLALSRTEPRGEVARSLSERVRDVRSTFDARYRRAEADAAADLPSRMLAAAHLASDRDMAQIGKELDRLSTLEARLSAVGLLPGVQPLPDPNTVASESLGMLVFLAKGRAEKLAVFEPLLARLEFVQGRINAKLVGKSVVVSEDGYRVRLASGEFHGVESLSSGELQELVMLHAFMFGTEPGSLVLIDEPETSLHLTWQEQFLDDLQAAAHLGRFNALIATHSPFIAGDRIELLTPIGGEPP